MEHQKLMEIQADIFYLVRQLVQEIERLQDEFGYLRNQLEERGEK